MLVDAVLKGDRLALARLLTQVENNTEDGRAALSRIFPRTGNAHLIGVTGAPGTGKSTLVNQLALRFRSENQRVAIVAVDPSSPFTGGAVLGDRVRMKDLGADPGVFIRSMASRGALGGLARATTGVVQVFDAANYQIVLIETVGAGQGEVDVARLAHTTLVVEAPGFGDDIQAIKAGILEIADILVINKADRPGVESTEKALRSALDFAHPDERDFAHHGKLLDREPPARPAEQHWRTPIQRTVATDGTGIPELAASIRKHADYLRSGGNWAGREQARLVSELAAHIDELLLDRFHAGLPQGRYNEVVQQVVQRQISPGDAARKLVDDGNPGEKARNQRGRAK
jgi:LAO/AO transport system kinase